jgi:Tol biopolymer transport system component
VEGSTLRGAQLPLRKVLDIGAQIAEGLAAAHGAGITHRDLKPDNVMVTKDGRVKILDFGLAKVRRPQGGEESRTAVSDPGAVMGTVGYMSPEQVRAQAMDGRSDIFSLGVLLHELIRGERPFQGDSAAETMAAIMKADAPPLPESTPSGVTRVIDKCLAKQPEERWQSPRDLASQLRWLADGGTSTGSQKPVPAVRQRPWGWIVAGALAVALIGLAVAYFRQTPPEAPLIKFLVQPPEKATSLENPTISPDGRTLAFTATVDGKRQLWIHPLDDSLSARPLAGTEDADYPFWSPDSRFLGFFAQNELKKVEVPGGAVLTLCDAADNGRGGTWNRDGLIVFGTGIRSLLSKVPASGGTPTAVTALGDGELSHRWPWFLPDGQHFLYWTRASDRSQNSVLVASLDGPAQSSQHQRLVRGGSMPLYADGNLLLVREDGMLVAQGFNAGGRVLLGEATPLGLNVDPRPGRPGFAQYSASGNGVLAYLSGGGGQSHLEIRDRSGQLLSTLGQVGDWRSVALSPDGARVAANRRDARAPADLWVHDIARNTSNRFTFDPAADFGPVWSPDSTRVFFSSSRVGGGSVYAKDASGATEEKLLLKAMPGETLAPWSFDGQHLLYSGMGQKGTQDLFVLSVDGEPKPVPFLATDFNEDQGQFSSDGHWVAYRSDELGRYEIYVRRFPQTGGKWQVSVAGGTQPRWRRDGLEIYYVAPGNKLMAVKVKPSGGAFEVASAKELFALKATRGGGGYDFDLTADGKRFLVNSLIEGTVTPITVVLNWMRKLKKP